MPAMNDIYWEATPMPNGKGFRGVIKFKISGPLSGQHTVTVASASKEADDAILKAAGIAQQITQNPIISALLPPGTPLAIEATKRIANAVKIGELDDQLRKIGGPAGERLASALSSVKSGIKKLKFW